MSHRRNLESWISSGKSCKEAGKNPGADLKAGACLGWGNFYSASRAGWYLLLQRLPTSSGARVSGQPRGGKGTCSFTWDQGKKTTRKVTENCNEWGDGLCPTVCSALPGTALLLFRREAEFMLFKRRNTRMRLIASFLRHYHIFGCWQVLTWITAIEVHCLVELFCLPQMSLKCTCSTRLVT